MQVVVQSARLAAGRRSVSLQQARGRRASVVTAAQPQFRTIREDIDRTRLKKQGVIKTVKGGSEGAAAPKPAAPAKQQQQGEGPNYGLIAGALLVPLALWLVLSGGQ